MQVVDLRPPDLPPPPAWVFRVLAGIDTGAVAGLILLVWFAVHSRLLREPWWAKFNLAAAPFFGERIFVMGPGLATHHRHAGGRRASVSALLPAFRGLLPAGLQPRSGPGLSAGRPVDDGMACFRGPLVLAPAGLLRGRLVPLVRHCAGPCCHGDPSAPLPCPLPPLAGFAGAGAGVGAASWRRVHGCISRHGRRFRGPSRDSGRASRAACG